MNTTPNQANIPSYGQLAYDAYCATRGWKSFDGKPLPQWPDVKEETQVGWIAAATEVLRIVGGAQINLLRRESTSVVRQLVADVAVVTDENAALRQQIGELQAEIEGLAKVKVCKNCANFGDIKGVLDLCGLEGNMQFNPDTQESSHMQVSPNFGCDCFKAKEGK